MSLSAMLSPVAEVMILAKRPRRARCRLALIRTGLKTQGSLVTRVHALVQQALLARSQLAEDGSGLQWPFRSARGENTECSGQGFALPTAARSHARDIARLGQKARNTMMITVTAAMMVTVTNPVTMAVAMAMTMMKLRMMMTSRRRRRRRR